MVLLIDLILNFSVARPGFATFNPDEDPDELYK